MFVSFQREGEIGELITSLKDVQNTIDEKIASSLLGTEQDFSDVEGDSDDEEGASDMDVDNDDDDDDSEDDDNEDNTDSDDDEENEEGDSGDEDGEDELGNKGSPKKRKWVCKANLSDIRNFDVEDVVPSL